MDFTAGGLYSIGKDKDKEKRPLKYEEKGGKASSAQEEEALRHLLFHNAHGL